MALATPIKKIQLLLNSRLSGKSNVNLSAVKSAKPPVKKYFKSFKIIKRKMNHDKKAEDKKNSGSVIHVSVEPDKKPK